MSGDIAKTWTAGDQVVAEDLNDSFDSAHEWQQVAEAELGAAASSITVSGIPNRLYLQVRIYVPSRAGSSALEIRFNGDSGSNYGARYSKNLGAFATSNGASTLTICDANTVADTFILEIWNRRSQNKVITFYGTRTAGSGNIPDHFVGAGHWLNTASEIVSILIQSSDASNLAAGTKVTVYAKKDTS